MAWMAGAAVLALFAGAAPTRSSEGQARASDHVAVLLHRGPAARGLQ